MGVAWGHLSSPPPPDLAATPSPSQVPLTTAPGPPSSLPFKALQGPTGRPPSWPLLARGCPIRLQVFACAVPSSRNAVPRAPSSPTPLSAAAPLLSALTCAVSPPHPPNRGAPRGPDSNSQKALRFPWVRPERPLPLFSLGGVGNFQILALNGRGCGSCGQNPSPRRSPRPGHSAGSPGATRGGGKGWRSARFQDGKLRHGAIRGPAPGTPAGAGRSGVRTRDPLIPGS